MVKSWMIGCFEMIIIDYHRLMVEFGLELYSIRIIGNFEWSSMLPKFIYITKYGYMVSKELFRLKLVSKELFGKDCFKKDFEKI